MTHRSLQSAKDAAEKKKRGGGSNGAGKLLNRGKSEESGEEEGRGGMEGRWCVPALDGANGGEGKVRVSPVGPIYRLARSVSQR